MFTIPINWSGFTGKYASTIIWDGTVPFSFPKSRKLIAMSVSKKIQVSVAPPIIVPVVHVDVILTVVSPLLPELASDYGLAVGFNKIYNANKIKVSTSEPYSFYPISLDEFYLEMSVFSETLTVNINYSVTGYITLIFED